MVCANHNSLAEIIPTGKLTLIQALLQAETQARSTLDTALYERLSCAVALAKEGQVAQDTAGNWTVASVSRPGVRHTVNGHCGCEDAFYQAPEGLCKHRLAVYLTRRAMELMETPPASVVPQEPQEATSTIQPTTATSCTTIRGTELPEAPASVNCHLTIAGRQVQLTLRDTDEERLLARLQAVLARYPVAEKSTAADSREGFCPIHNVPMKANHKNGRTWYSHQIDGQWCKGR